MIVDDSASTRTLLRGVLAKEPDMEVSASAPDGEKALRWLKGIDVVVLDLQMPNMDGLETLKHIREQNSELPVIIYSEHSAEGARQTVDALMFGASACIRKFNSDHGASVVQFIQQNLATKIRELHESGHRRKSPARVAPPKVPNMVEKRPDAAIRAVVIASSTGGPQALRQVFTDLPQKLPAPVFVVQHMPAEFTTELARQLSRYGHHEVREAEEGAVVEAGSVWLAPGGYHMGLKQERGRTVLRLNQAPEENSVRPAADVTLRAAAEIYGKNLLCVVLTGMGADGARGCALARKNGAYVLVQDEDSSVIWGMPGAVVRLGCVDEVLPLGRIGATIGKLVNGRAKRKAG